MNNTSADIWLLTYFNYLDYSKSGASKTLQSYKVTELQNYNTLYWG